MIPRRAVVVSATFSLSVLLYIDRACIATAKDPVMHDLVLTKEQWSWVLAAFAFGYALLQTPSGALADRFGGRAVLTAVVTLWSIFTGLTAAAFDFVSLLVMRFLFGAGEAGAFPGIAQVVYRWIPLNERGLVKGINFSGSRIGAAAAMPLVAGLIAVVGWQLAFLLLMAVGFVWAGFWWWWFRDEPAAHGGLSEAELAIILQSRGAASSTAAPSQAKPAPLRPGTLLGSGNLWLMMVQYFGSNFTFFFSLTWLYPYVKDRYDLEEVSAGMYAMAPLLAGAAGNVFSGWLVDRLYRGGHLANSRRLPAIVGFLLAAAGMVISLYQQTPLGAVAWLSVAIFGADMTLAPSWAFCVDIGGRHAGAFSGTMNMAGNLGAAITALSFAYLPASQQGNVAFFFLAAALSCLSIVCWLLARPPRPAEHQEKSA